MGPPWVSMWGERGGVASRLPSLAGSPIRQVGMGEATSGQGMVSLGSTKRPGTASEGEVGWRRRVTVTSKRMDVKRHGKHYTPTLLAAFLAERVLAQVEDKSVVRVLDPACGDGELLFAIHRVAEQHGVQAALSLVGYDLDRAAVEVAQSRAEALGISVAWHVGDFLEAGENCPQVRSMW